MPVLYRTIDKRNWTHQPQLTRWRHRWRGNRESLKVNTEINQTFYDLTRLNTRAETVDSTLETNRDTIRDGGYLGGIDFQWASDATPTIEPVFLPGMDDVTTRIELLRKRIRDLEDQ